MSKSVIIDNLINDQLYGFRIFPRNLKGQYQTELDGATATATPKAIDPIFGNNSWEVIDSVSRSGNIPSTWHVGDTKDITLTTGETLTMQIYGFKHDDLTSGGKAGITLGMKNLMANTKAYYEINLLNIFEFLPQDLKIYVKNVMKKTYKTGGTSEELSHKLFLYSEYEVFGIVKKSYGVEGTKYEIFTDNESRIKKISNTNTYWWLRSIDKEYSGGDRNCMVWTTGEIGSSYTYNKNGVCFGFCI